MTWVFVKATLILNYLGQGAWLLTNPNVNTHTVNPFFAIMPQWFLIPGIIIATLAAIIASQALISGSFSIVNEAILLNFWPKLKVKYPTVLKGQMYIPGINYFLWFFCLLVVIFFQKSSNMEAAYGLSITITMLMTTALLVVLFIKRKITWLITIPFALIYLIVEGGFLVANLNKFMHGGWVTIVIAGLIFIIMYIWYSARTLKNKFTPLEKLDPYYQLFNDLKAEPLIPKYASNLVYLTRSGSNVQIESKIIASIFKKQPKRADLYWLVHIDIVDDPHTKEYAVTTLIPGTLIKVDFRLGFQVQPRINLYFREVLDEMAAHKEIDLTSTYPSLRKHDIPSDFRFILIDRIQNYDFDFPGFDQLIMDIYAILKRIGISEVRAFGLDTSNIQVEKVSLRLPSKVHSGLKRVK
jgi:KUP system potassium uptake protein